jgi:hypothetical protein
MSITYYSLAKIFFTPSSDVIASRRGSDLSTARSRSAVGTGSVTSERGFINARSCIEVQSLSFAVEAEAMDQVAEGLLSEERSEDPLFFTFDTVVSEH